jgi:hypothetical protein
MVSSNNRNHNCNHSGSMVQIAFARWSGPPIIPADPAREREQLITANRAFAAALKRALQSGAETTAGVLVTNPKASGEPRRLLSST